MLKFKINQERFLALCQLRGWKHPQSDLARATGFTRSYVRSVLTGNEEVTQQFMLRYIAICGVDPTNKNAWAALFDVVGRLDTFQQWNDAKYRKHVPYRRRSIQAEFRKMDDPDLEETDEGEPA